MRSDQGSLTRDQTCDPAVEAQSLNHWTASEVLKKCFDKTDQQKYNVEQVIAHILSGLIWLISSTNSSQTQIDLFFFKYQHYWTSS